MEVWESCLICPPLWHTKPSSEWLYHSAVMTWGAKASQLPSLCLMGKAHRCPSTQTGTQLTPVLPLRLWPSSGLSHCFQGSKTQLLAPKQCPLQDSSLTSIFYCPALAACCMLTEKPALLVPRDNTGSSGSTIHSSTRCDYQQTGQQSSVKVSCTGGLLLLPLGYFS